VSVIFASGDLGVGSACLTNDGTNRTRFSPIFPATCPWVTSVGATQNNSPEEAVYFSAGGFSDLWLRPAYQDVAVKSYLEKLGGRWTGLYNPRGRGFPDVSAQGVNYVVVSQGQLRSDFNGTSASAPTFASIVALLNDARLRSNRPALGFLNPWLYSSGYTALNDVVLGGSTGCDGHAPFHGPPNGSPVVPYASWNATDGWDPVTGLGTPDFSKLLNLVTSNSNCTSQH
jgi:tripeptidyl-peptidase-1